MLEAQALRQKLLEMESRMAARQEDRVVRDLGVPTAALSNHAVSGPEQPAVGLFELGERSQLAMSPALVRQGDNGDFPQQLFRIIPCLVLPYIIVMYHNFQGQFMAIFNLTVGKRLVQPSEAFVPSSRSQCGASRSWRSPRCDGSSIKGKMSRFPMCSSAPTSRTECELTYSLDVLVSQLPIVRY